MTQISLMPDAVLPLVGGEFVPVVQGGNNYKAPASAFQTSGNTNLSISRTVTAVTILSDTGDDATIPIADVSLAGVMSSADFVKLTSIQAGATANQTDSYLLNRANHTSTQTLATISDAGTAAALDAGFLAGQLPPLEGDSRLAALDGSLLTNLPLGDYLQSVDLGLTRDTVQATITNTGGADVSIPTASGTLAGVMSSASYTKLFGIATGATANQTDTYLLSRSNHTGTQGSSTISDFSPGVRGQVESMLAEGNNISFDYSGSGATRQITINALTGGSGSTNLSIANRTSTYLDVASDTGSNARVPAATAALAGLFISTDKSKLDGIQPGATVNSSDAALRARSSHTGTQTASTISDFAATSRAETESTLVAGANITLTPAGTGATRTITITGTDGGGGGVSSVDSGAGLTGGPITDTGTLAVGAGTGITVTADAVAVDTAYLDTLYADGTVTSVGGGNGLTGQVTTTGALNVGAGTGITVNPDDVALDTDFTDARYYTQTAADAAFGAGTVTQVDTGTGLSGGPITDSGTVVLDTGFTDDRYYVKATADTTFLSSDIGTYTPL